MNKDINETIILASYSRSVWAKLKLDHYQVELKLGSVIVELNSSSFGHCRAELELEQLKPSSEPSSSILILGSNRLTNLMSFFILIDFYYLYIKNLKSRSSSITKIKLSMNNEFVFHSIKELN